MSQELLDKFAKKVSPYRHLWKSVHLVCFAARNSQAWVVLATRISFSEMPPTKSRNLKPIEDFLAVSIEMPIQSFGQVLYNILVEGFVPIEFDSTPIKGYLSRRHAGLPPGQVGTLTWFDVVTHEPGEFSPQYGTKRPMVSLSAWGERRYDVLSDDSLRELNSKLRLRDSPYDGLNALLAEWMPGIEEAHESQAPIQILARVPFDMDFIEPGRVTVRGPVEAEQCLRARSFFRPRGTDQLHLVQRQLSDEVGANGIAVWEAPIEWPKESLGAKVVLFFNDNEIDSFEVNRWPHSASISAAMNVFFDPEHKRLREAVAGRSRVKDSFEVGVVRLLNLLGIPAIWYGKGVAEGRPDLAGLLSGRKTSLIVLGECTRERPDAKFSGLAQRARELRENFSNEIGVLPIVFTPAETTDSEFQKAVEHNVSLVGREKLERLLRFLETGKSREDVLTFLRVMRLGDSVMAYEVGFLPRR